MASDAILPPGAPSVTADAALQHSPWNSFTSLSSMLAVPEQFLARAGFDRAPWLAVAFAGGIAAWFMLDNRWQWLAMLAACCAVVLGAAALLRGDGRFPYLRQALMVAPLMIAAGCLTVWTKSALVGAAPIAKPVFTQLTGTLRDCRPQPAEKRVRLLIAAREQGSGRAIRVRVNAGSRTDCTGLTRGAQVRVKARLMPPAPPLLPGGYDFARAAWFAGLSATGSAMGPVEVLSSGNGDGAIGKAQASLSRHVRAQLDGTSGAIAAALASGDRGAIPEADDQAMRDSGLAHLLSISGLHVSAVVGAAYVLAMRLLALWPWLALRVRLPLLAAGAGALAGIGYTLLTGAEVPTVRSCVGAVLVLGALALGREPLSLRMLAVAALFVMLFWPEAVVGPSFQLSFAAAIAIVSLYGAAPIRAFLAPRDEGALRRGGRLLAMLLLTGVVIELALMPIGLFHFHRAGIYGALANVIAIPLTTLITMPLIALALVLDLAGLGAPAWWLAGKSLDLLIAMAHWIAARPGSVTLLPAFGAGAMALFVAGGLWLALWRGQVRLWGLVPVLLGMVWLGTLRPPDVLISRDGRHVGITSKGSLIVLREGRGGYASDTLSEVAGMNGALVPLAQWPGAQCSSDFCAVTLTRGARDWRILIARSRDNVPERALAAACERVDIVIADRWLPRSCRPVWFKADRAMLERSGGLAIEFDGPRVTTVAQSQGAHGWWQGSAIRAYPGKRPCTSANGKELCAASGKAASGGGPQ